jgi:outer membrane protein OmpA-like peptidoglycan-associated protein
MKKAIIIIMGLIISIAFVTTGMSKSKSAKPRTGRQIIITGCLHRGTSLDTFVLLGVTERPADPSEPTIPVPYAIYWLDSTKGLEQLVGKMVEVTGKVTSKEAKPGTITIAINPDATLSTDVQIKSGKRDLTTKKFDYSDMPMATADSQSSLIMTRPVYNLAVDDVSAVDAGAEGPPCQFEEKIIILATEITKPKVEEKVKIIAEEAKVEEKIIILAFEDVHFDYDKSTLKKEAKTILKRNIQLLIDNPKANIRIAGYTSASGTEEYNMKLSQRRAKAVEEYLVNEGVVSQERLTTIGYGETNPAEYESAPTTLYSKAAKANMRVLFEIVVE